MIIITIIAILFAIICVITRIKSDTEIASQNEKIRQANQELKKENLYLEELKDKLEQNNNKLNTENNNLIESNKVQRTYLQNIQEDIQNISKNQEALSKKAFENFWQLLEKDYEEKSNEYDLLCSNLKEAYSKKQEEVLKNIAKCESDLEKIRSTRDAAMQAQIKEKEIKDQLSFYCLTPSQNDLDDVKKLERIKPDLHNPRILSMLIWSTYFQKPMTSLCNNILGIETITGIYKITNQIDNMCYIGQSVDISSRWKQHAKCGLGIDTPANNKLYKAMIQDGIWNFSWEILEECPKNELDEKEKFYINLYQSYEYGYNSNTGIGK